ncbi:MAG TPA: hypothetical protein VF503_09120 [Sphingobium sp.]|uniref:phage baseplate assembly protein n=1 Tax=Sphingobium sp. TaxID=1912891 RepID=UPI002ED5EF6C
MPATSAAETSPNPDIVVTANTAQTDEVSIITQGCEVSGWEEIAITLRAEGFPPSFDIAMSAQHPIAPSDAQNNDPSINEILGYQGDAQRQTLQVKIGTQIVITGYIDTSGEDGTAETHRLRVMGRGKTQDLIDASAEIPTGYLNNASTYEVCATLCETYGIDVVLSTDSKLVDEAVPQASLNYGETAADLIQRYSRYSSVLAYEDSSGNLVLADAGADTASSGVAFGVNIQEYSIQNDVSQLVSEICVTQSSVDNFQDLGDGGFILLTVPSPVPVRHRRLYMPQEQSAEGIAFTERKAKWEMARRIGRSVSVRVTVDSWRDSAGNLWKPNTMIPITHPALRIADKELCLSEVTFKRSNATGTTAEMLLLPKAAFAPEPVNLTPANVSDISAPDAK